MAKGCADASVDTLKHRYGETPTLPSSNRGSNYSLSCAQVAKPALCGTAHRKQQMEDAAVCSSWREQRTCFGCVWLLTSHGDHPLQRCMLRLWRPRPGLRSEHGQQHLDLGAVSQLEMASLCALGRLETVLESKAGLGRAERFGHLPDCDRLGKFPWLTAAGGDPVMVFLVPWPK